MLMKSFLEDEYLTSTEEKVCRTIQSFPLLNFVKINVLVAILSFVIERFMQGIIAFDKEVTNLEDNTKICILLKVC